MKTHNEGFKATCTNCGSRGYGASMEVAKSAVDHEEFCSKPIYEVDSFQIGQYVYVLVEVLKASKPEYDTIGSDDDNWQAEKAREICQELLTASKANGFGACRLCKS